MEEEWESPEGHPYSNPYSNPELEEEWETPEGHPYSNPEWEEEWETHEGHPYSNPEWENEADRFFPIIAKVAGKLLPKAIKLGRNLFRGMKHPDNQQIAGLFH